MAVGADRSREPTLLTEVGREDNAAAFSPDGRRIAFVSTRDAPASDGPGDLYVMDADGGNVVRLTSGLAVQAQPSWSPDGRSIVISGSANGRGEVYLVDVLTKEVRRLTRGFEGVR